MSEVSSEEWKAAEEHFFSTLRLYRNICTDPGLRNANIYFVARITLIPIMTRWILGDDTRELFNDMMEVK